MFFSLPDLEISRMVSGGLGQAPADTEEGRVISIPARGGGGW